MSSSVEHIGYRSHEIRLHLPHGKTGKRIFNGGAGRSKGDDRSVEHRSEGRELHHWESGNAQSIDLLISKTRTPGGITALNWMNEL